jgi:hypothetical protein
MPTPERRIALIPRAQYTGGRRTVGEYALYVTNYRTLMVAEKVSKLPRWGGPGHVFTVGAAGDWALQMPRMVDYATATPDGLAAMEGTIEIGHSGLDRLETHRVLGTLYLQFYYTSRRMRPHVQVLVLPPQALLAARRKEGHSARQTRIAYWRDAEEAYRRAIPEDARGRSKWAN